MDALIDQLASAGPRALHHLLRHVGDVGIGYANDLTRTGELSGRFVRWQRRALDLGFKVGRPQAAQALCHVRVRDGTVRRRGQRGRHPVELLGDRRPAGLGCRLRHRATCPPRPPETAGSAARTCTAQHDDKRTLAAFRDAVDAGLFDYLDETQRL